MHNLSKGKIDQGILPVANCSSIGQVRVDCFAQFIAIQNLVLVRYKMTRAISLVVFLAVLGGFVSVQSEFTQEREEILDENGLYRVHWSIDYENKVVMYNVTCQTTGFVGFGISNNGGMAGADIVIGGIHTNGTPYFDDRHGVGMTLPAVDISQDWEFLGGSENATHTHLQFLRKFDTCDSQDMPFTNDTTSYIWSFGATDEITYHGSDNRGTFRVNILDTEMPPLDTSKFMRFEVTMNMTMPSADTTYWCKIVRSPTFTQKHHFVAFDTMFGSPEAKKHTHHYTLYRCIAPRGIDPVEHFEPYVGHPGSDCYMDEPLVPVEDCQPMLYVWALGGKMFTFPDNVGYPVGESSTTDYYMFEVHYDNPDMLEGVAFETGVIVYYTDEVRPVDAGIMVIKSPSNPALTIPPKSDSFKAVGHCGSSCTASYLPSSGINIFAVLLHSHLSGRQHKFRHFRQNEELPWIAYDNNYDFDYQQTRLMKNHLNILPGDHLAAECTFDTTWTEGTTIGGLSSNHEMCQHFVWYYPRMDMGFCSSNYPMEKIFEKFGIEEVTGSHFNPTVVAPPHLANMTYQEVVDMIQWTPELRQELQEDLLNSIHENSCTADSGSEVWYNTTFPQVAVEYQPPTECP